MRNVITIVIVLAAVACGYAGYEYGRRTALRPWVKERDALYEERLALVKKIRPMREITRYTVKKPGKKAPARKRPRKPTTTRAARAKTTTKAARTR